MTLLSGPNPAALRTRPGAPRADTTARPDRNRGHSRTWLNGSHRKNRKDHPSAYCNIFKNDVSTLLVISPKWIILDIIPLTINRQDAANINVPPIWLIFIHHDFFVMANTLHQRLEGVCHSCLKAPASPHSGPRSTGPATTFLSRSCPIWASLMPRMPDRISSVCWPRIGAGRAFSRGKPLNDRGEPGIR